MNSTYFDLRPVFKNPLSREPEGWLQHQLQKGKVAPVLTYLHI
jgi:hypothetical protein